MRRSAAGLALLMAAALMAACGNDAPQFQLTDVTGAEFGRDFQLTDHTGRPRALADFRGKVVAIFFGFAHCPEVCPTALADLASVVNGLGKDADRMQVLLITVDPERDTPAVLSQYVAAFHPGFLGLYGDADATSRTAKEFRVFYQKQPLPGGGYTVDHSAGTYIYDTAGRLRLFAGYGQGAPKMLHDIRLLLQNG